MSVKVGDIFTSNNSGDFEVIEKLPSKKVRIKFLKTGFISEPYICQVRSGCVKDKLLPTIYGVGFYGHGYTESLSTEQVKITWQAWRDMFKRCYDERSLKKRPSYAGCEVDEQWYNFQAFARFYIEDAYRMDKWQLDKDLLFKGNKIYSPETCVFLPRELNGLIIRNESIRGKYPIGVSITSSGKFKAACVKNSKQEFLGLFENPTAAFNCYKNYKESLIREQAEIWKTRIDPRAYQALVEYCVSMED